MPGYSKNRLFSRFVGKLNQSSQITSTGIASGAVDEGVTVYDSAGLLPSSGMSAGDQAWSGNRLYISNGSGWYNVALVNADPRFVSITDSDGGTTPFALATDGATPITITLVGADSDGVDVTYSYTKDSGFDGLATITGSGTEYTVTPLSEDSATTSSGTVTFKVSDGISFDTSVNTFTLSFAQGIVDPSNMSAAAFTTDATYGGGTHRGSVIYGNYLFIIRQYTVPVFDISSPDNPTGVANTSVNPINSTPYYDLAPRAGGNNFSLDDRGNLWTCRAGYPLRSFTLNGNNGSFVENAGYITAPSNLSAIDTRGEYLFMGLHDNTNPSIRVYDISDVTTAPSLLQTSVMTGYGSSYWTTSVYTTDISSDVIRIYTVYQYQTSGIVLAWHEYTKSTNTLSFLNTAFFNNSVSFSSNGVFATVASDIDDQYDYIYAKPTAAANDYIYHIRISKSGGASASYNAGYLAQSEFTADTGFIQYKENKLYILSNVRLYVYDVSSNNNGAPSFAGKYGTDGGQNIVGDSNTQYVNNTGFKGGRYYVVAYSNSTSNQAIS